MLARKHESGMYQLKDGTCLFDVPLIYKIILRGGSIIKRTSRKPGSKLMIVALIAISIMLTWTMAPAVSAEQTFMTQNLYIGAEIASLAKAGNPNDFIIRAQQALMQVAANDFPARAEAIAAEIIEKDPHIIGLQEVWNFTVNGYNGPPPFRNYLDDILTALEAQGASYYVAGTVTDMDIALPIPGFGLVGITDHDVILARADVPATPVNLSWFCAKPSGDGCNFQAVAGANIPGIGTINFERGFVAVDAEIEGHPVRVVNTHLEVRDIDPDNPASPAIQAYQAYELVNILNYLPNPQDAPVITLGDINSDPREEIINIWGMTIVPPYMQLSARNVDLWTLRPGKPKGLTCCQEEDLHSPDPVLYERVDVIFSSVVPEQVKVNTVGNDEDDFLTWGIWPSDHAGIVARVELY